MKVNVKRFGFSPVISTNIHRCLSNNLHDLKVLKMVIKTEMSSVDFHN